MADAADLKSASLTGVWVQIPPSALSPFQLKSVNKISYFRIHLEVSMDWQFIITVGTITLVILFILTGIIVSVVLFAVMGLANE
jgi:hypothetical protein